MIKIKHLCLIALATVASTAVCPAETTEENDSWPAVDAKALQEWQALGFGMFIHWGPVSLTGHEIGWSRGNQTPIETYDNLYKKFNPVKFDANEWVKTARDAGMKYLVITTKHHDGFCLWPSDVTEYDIAATPFKRDVLAELSKACKKYEIKFGTYYSACDWWHPAYPKGSPAGQTKKPTADIKAYDLYLRAQTEELITRYGPLLTIWFDVPRSYTREYGLGMVHQLRKLQPDILINNRAFSNRGERGYLKKDGDYSTPEQKIGGFNRERPWETCMTICRQWSWKPNDKMKSLKQCIQTLLFTVGGDGNLLFNVGPMPDGRIEPRQVERLKEMGDWLKDYKKQIYNTRGGPFKPAKWGASTCQGNKINLFVMKWNNDNTLTLPPIEMKIKSAKCLSGGKVSFQQSGDGITLSLPKEDQQDIATVIILKVAGNAFNIPPMKITDKPSGSLATNKKATASNTFKNQKDYAPSKAFDDNPETRWATDANTKTAWLEVDLGKPTKIGHVMIDEREWNRVRKFELQIKSDDTWKTIHEGTKIGANYNKSFTTIDAQHVRLNMLESTDGPTIWEFQLFDK